MTEPAETPRAALLETALIAALGSPVVVTGLQRLTAGATKQTWQVAATVAGKAQLFILQTLPPGRLQARADADRPADANAPLRPLLQARTLTPEQDSKIMQLAHAHGVPVPRLVLQLEPRHGLGLGQVTTFVAGETLAPKILREARFDFAREQLTAQCAQALANTHRIPADQVAFLPAKDANQQWQDNRAQVDAHGIRHAALEWGLRWVEERLGEHANQVPTPVHGDFRLGNFIVSEQGLAAVIDWELAHLGEAMQDLAWLCLRTWRFGGSQPVGGFGRREDLYAAYEKFSGKPIDENRVFFWEMACQVRWAVMCLGMGQGAPAAPAPSVSLEHRLIGRRMEEPLWDMLQMVKTARLQGDKS